MEEPPRDMPAEADRARAELRAADERRAEDGPLTDSRLSRRLLGSRPAVARFAASSLSALLASRLLQGSRVSWRVRQTCSSCESHAGGYVVVLSRGSSIEEEYRIVELQH